MNAPAVIERLQQLGVSVEVDGAEVFVDPAERVPDELWPELSRRKLDIFAFLMTERIISETPNPNALIDRLRIGHRWVSASAQFLADDPTHGAGTSRLPETMRWTRVWDSAGQAPSPDLRLQGMHPGRAEVPGCRWPAVQGLPACLNTVFVAAGPEYGRRTSKEFASNGPEASFECDA